MTRPWTRFCMFFVRGDVDHRALLSFPTRRSSDLRGRRARNGDRPMTLRTQMIPDSGVKTAVPGLEPDRKSTRLNSSHVEISYAVFCLKKKKILRQPLRHREQFKPHSAGKESTDVT